MKKVSGFFISGLFVLSLVACGGSDGGGGSGVNDVDDLVGLWDFSYEVDGLVDEIYMEISGTGYASIYDYFGDSFDDVADCYVIAEDALLITHLDGNEFLSESQEDGTTASFTASFSGDDIIITDVDGDTRLTPSSLDIDEVYANECTADDLSNLFFKSGLDVDSGRGDLPTAKKSVLGVQF